MKINVEVDCTPDEARRFFGLPDVAPMQQAVMAKLQEQMLAAVTVTSPEALLKTWAPMVPQTPEQMQQAMTNFFRLFTPGGGGSGKPGQG